MKARFNIDPRVRKNSSNVTTAASLLNPVEEQNGIIISQDSCSVAD